MAHTPAVITSPASMATTIAPCRNSKCRSGDAEVLIPAASTAMTQTQNNAESAAVSFQKGLTRDAGGTLRSLRVQRFDVRCNALRQGIEVIAPFEQTH